MSDAAATTVVVYRYLYRKAGAAVQLQLAGGTYSVKWFDARNGGALQQGSVTAVTGGSAAVALGSPPSNTEQNGVALIQCTSC
jgi:diaminopimelate epimerase